MSTAMVALVGEQPMPVLLPVKLYTRKYDLKSVVLVFTARTKRVSRNLRKLLQEAGLSVLEKEVDAYGNIAPLSSQLVELYSELSGSHAVEYNPTGATKLMAIAAYDAALRTGGDFIYLQTEGPEDVIHRYSMESGQPRLLRKENLPRDLINIHEYLAAYTDEYSSSKPQGNEKGRAFEEAIRSALEEEVDEIMFRKSLKVKRSSFEVDVIVRIGNRIGAIEAKFKDRGKAKGMKEAIGQIMTATAREVLGIYTSRMLVTNVWDPNIEKLAYDFRITFVALTDFDPDQKTLSPESKTLLVSQTRKAMGYGNDNY